MKRPAAFGAFLASRATTMVPKFVPIVAVYVFLGSATNPVSFTLGGATVVGVVDGTVVLLEALLLPLLVTMLISTIPRTKTPATIAALRAPCIRRRRFSAARRASRAIRALSFLRWRLSAAGTAGQS